jgi:hypothetical protein
MKFKQDSFISSLCRPVICVAALTLLSAVDASAHLTYTGRNFGTFSGTELQLPVANQSVSSAFGWADGTDADFGDSHRTRAYRFTLTTELTVTISVQAVAFGTNVAGLLPGFSIFAGLAHTTGEADHDGSASSLAYLASLGGKEGAFRALADWKIGSDDNSTVAPFADLSSFVFMGYAVDGVADNYGTEPGIVGDGVADGYVTGTFTLPAGDYSVFVGGADYAAGVGAVAPYTNYGVATTFVATPEPTSAALLACSGLILLAGRRRRKGNAVV